MSHRHALIIEDEILIAMEVEALLEEQGFDSFDIAESPEQALICAMRRAPDLITADYRIVGGSWGPFPWSMSPAMPPSFMAAPRWSSTSRSRRVGWPKPAPGRPALRSRASGLGISTAGG
jgi:DNA-binding NarL/FixJ family response regulator